MKSRLLVFGCLAGAVLAAGVGCNRSDSGSGTGAQPPANTVPAPEPGQPAKTEGMPGGGASLPPPPGFKPPEK